MIQIKAFLIFFALAHTLLAFKVDFFNNPDCQGISVGDWVGGKGQGCQKSKKPEVQGAFIASTGAVDDTTLVQFYTSDNCAPGTELVGSPMDCIGVRGSFLGDYQSWQVVDIIVQPPVSLDMTTTDDSVATMFQPQTTEPARLKPRRDSQPPNPIARVEPYLYHGMVIDVDDVLHKWHQLCDGVFVSVPLHEWDDEIHVPEHRTYFELFGRIDSPVRRDIVFDNTTSFNPGLLGEKIDILNTCHVFMGCVSNLSKALYLDAILGYVGLKIKDFATKTGKDFWGFITDRQFAMGISTQTIAGILAPAINGQLGTTSTITVTVSATGDVARNAMACSSTPPSGVLEKDNELARELFMLYMNHPAGKYSESLEIIVDRNLGEQDSGFKVRVNMLSCDEDIKRESCGMKTGICPPPGTTFSTTMSS